MTSGLASRASSSQGGYHLVLVLVYRDASPSGPNEAFSRVLYRNALLDLCACGGSFCVCYVCGGRMMFKVCATFYSNSSMLQLLKLYFLERYSDLLVMGAFHGLYVLGSSITSCPYTHIYIYISLPPE